MERRLAAIMAGDVVGYSRLMADDEAGTYDYVCNVHAPGMAGQIMVK